MFCCWALCGCRVFFCFCFGLFFFGWRGEGLGSFCLLFCFCFVIFLLWCVLCYTFHSCQNPPGILNTWRAVSCSFVTQLSALAKSLQLKIHWSVNCKSGSVGWLNFRHPPTWSRVQKQSFVYWIKSHLSIVITPHQSVSCKEVLEMEKSLQKWPR